MRTPASTFFSFFAFFALVIFLFLFTFVFVVCEVAAAAPLFVEGTLRSSSFLESKRLGFVHFTGTAWLDVDVNGWFRLQGRREILCEMRGGERIMT